MAAAAMLLSQERLGNPSNAERHVGIN